MILLLSYFLLFRLRAPRLGGAFDSRSDFPTVLPTLPSSFIPLVLSEFGIDTGRVEIMKYYSFYPPPTRLKVMAAGVMTSYKGSAQ